MQIIWHAVSTILSTGLALFGLAVIIAEIGDNLPAILAALGLRGRVL